MKKSMISVLLILLFTAASGCAQKEKVPNLVASLKSDYMNVQTGDSITLTATLKNNTEQDIGIETDNFHVFKYYVGIKNNAIGEAITSINQKQ
jgi:hypothetical protein